MPTQDDIIQALRQVQEPELHKDLVTLNMIRDLTVAGGDVSFTIMLTTPACPLRGQIQEEARRAVVQVSGVKNVDVKLGAEVNRDSRLNNSKVLPPGVKNILAIAS